jgi:hypothetical protein
VIKYPQPKREERSLPTPSIGTVFTLRVEPDFCPTCQVCILDFEQLIDGGDTERCRVHLEVDLIRELDRIAATQVWEGSQGRGKVIQLLGWLTIHLVEQLGPSKAGFLVEDLVGHRIHKIEEPRQEIRFRINSCLYTFLQELANCWEWLDDDPNERFATLVGLSCWLGVTLEQKTGESFLEEAERLVREILHSFFERSDEVDLLVRRIRPTETAGL